MINTARQNMQFMLEGIRNTPMSSHHIRVIDIVGFRQEPYLRSPSTPSTTMNRCMAITGQSTWIPSRSQPMPSTPSTSQPMPSTSQPIPSTSQDMPSASQPMPSMPRTSRLMLASTNQPMLTSTSQPMSSTSQLMPSQRRPAVEMPPQKKFRTSNFGNVAAEATVSQAMPTSASTASASGAEKSSIFLKAFEEKGAEMVLTLANQLIAAFEKQNETIKIGLNAISESLLENVPKMVAEEFKKALNANASSGSAASGNASSDNAASGNASSENVARETLHRETLHNPLSFPFLKGLGLG